MNITKRFNSFMEEQPDTVQIATAICLFTTVTTLCAAAGWAVANYPVLLVSIPIGVVIFLFYMLVKFVFYLVTSSKEAN